MESSYYLAKYHGITFIIRKWLKKALDISFTNLFIEDFVDIGWSNITRKVRKIILVTNIYVYMHSCLKTQNLLNTLKLAKTENIILFKII